MDGLLIDSEPLWWRVEKAFAAQHGKVWTDAQAEQCVGTGLPNAVRAITRELDIAIDQGDGVRWLVDTFIARIDELALQPGATALLAAARGQRKLALATSSTARLMDAVMQRFADIAGCFDTKLNGDDVSNSKPAPDIFLLAAARLGCAPEDCVVLEDSIEGVQAAIAAGMQVIAVPEYGRERFTSLDAAVVDDLHQARTLLGM
jgi:sugar-phosphatase